MKVFKIFTLSLMIAMVSIVMCYIVYTFNMRNPYSEVYWIKDYPAVSDKYIEYTPVLKSDNSIVLGPSVGADYATLRFKDIDKDGTKEAVIETEVLIDFGEYYFPERHVLEYQESELGKPQFILVKSEAFPDKVPEIYKNFKKEN